jgi:DNA-binding transcriptional ArsR family regulator
MTDGQLNEIKSLLEDIKALLVVINLDKLDDLKKKLIKPESVESQVYELCDGTNTTQDMAAKIKKSQENVGAVISSLRRKGMIKTISREGRKYYEQIF